MGPVTISQIDVSETDPTLLVAGDPKTTSVVIVNAGGKAVDVLSDASGALGDGIPVQPGQWVKLKVSNSLFGIADTSAGDVRVAVCQGGDIEAAGLLFSDVVLP